MQVRLVLMYLHLMEFCVEENSGILHKNVWEHVWKNL